MHQVRWMAKVIYTFKVWMFRTQFKLTAREHRGLRELCIFFFGIYVEVWASATIAVKGPDKLSEDAEAIAELFKDISSATVKKMAGQLWFRTEELVALALFDNDFNNDTRQDGRGNERNQTKEKTLKRATIDVNTPQDKTLELYDQKFYTSFQKLWLSR